MASFARLYDTINEKEWFLRLLPEERCVYLQLLAYSTKDRGCLHTSNSWVLSQKLMIEEAFLTKTIEKLISIGRLEKAGDKLMLSDYSEYNPDPTNAKRQAEFKLRNAKKSVGNASNASNDNNAPEPEPEPEPLSLPIAREKSERPNLDLVTKTINDYNSEKPEGWVECIVPSVWLRQQIVSIIPANKDFDMKELCALAKQNDWLASGIFDITWFFDSDRKRGRLNFKRLLAGELANGRGVDGKQKQRTGKQRTGNLTPSGADF